MLRPRQTQATRNWLGNWVGAGSANLKPGFLVLAVGCIRENQGRGFALTRTMGEWVLKSVCDQQLCAEPQQLPLATSFSNSWAIVDNRR